MARADQVGPPVHRRRPPHRERRHRALSPSELHRAGARLGLDGTASDARNLTPFGGCAGRPGLKWFVRAYRSDRRLFRPDRRRRGIRRNDRQRHPWPGDPRRSGALRRCPRYRRPADPDPGPALPDPRDAPALHAGARSASSGGLERRGSSDLLGPSPSSRPWNLLGAGTDQVDAEDGGAPIRLGRTRPRRVLRRWSAPIPSRPRFVEAHLGHRLRGMLGFRGPRLVSLTGSSPIAPPSSSTPC